MKKIISLVLLVSIGSFGFPISQQAAEIPNESIIQPYAHIIEWRYKQINGVWHKRQYDWTAGKWLGSWTPV